MVTGSSHGIGRIVALKLAHDGFAVVVNYAGNTAKADGVVQEITSAGGPASAVQADMANTAEVARLFKEALAPFGGIDAVVNCAGIMPLGRIADGDIAMFDKVIATNLRGAFLVLGEAARHVTVNAVAPGPVATELFLNDKIPAQIEQFSKLSPLERLGQPEDIANVVSFLAGPDGGWVNGQVLRANGGFA
jgi:3-oxoacyl-[acyl-carrier protein] reductase